MMKYGEKNSSAAERDALTWEEVRTEYIVQDEWIDFRRTAYRFPDGNVYEPFYTYSRRDYVVIVASDTDGNYLCVRQFRQGIRKVTTEFPAGGIERKDGREYSSGDRSAKHGSAQDGFAPGGPVSDGPGQDGFAKHGSAQDSSAEDALAAAKRELLEETGCESDEWSHLLTVPSNATIADNYAHVFAAKNCRKVAGQSLDEMEFLNVRKYKAPEIEELIAKGEFQQAIHIMAWLLERRRKAQAISEVLPR